MHYKILTALSAVALMAVPAAAQQSQAKGRQAAKDAVYCLQFSSETGSRINRLECKTKKDWERLGVEFGERRSN
jgi:guanyl-specific ribonuclease Sa